MSARATVCVQCGEPIHEAHSVAVGVDLRGWPGEPPRSLYVCDHECESEWLAAHPDGVLRAGTEARAA